MGRAGQSEGRDQKVPSSPARPAVPPAVPSQSPARRARQVWRPEAVAPLRAQPPWGPPAAPAARLPHRPHASIPASSRLLRWPACSRVPTSVSVTGRDVLRAECLCPSQCVCCCPTLQRDGASRQGFRGAIGARRESPHVQVPRTRLLPSALCHVRTPREGGHRPTRRRALPRRPTDRRLHGGLPASGTGE